MLIQTRHKRPAVTSARLSLQSGILQDTQQNVVSLSTTEPFELRYFRQMKQFELIAAPTCRPSLCCLSVGGLVAHPSLMIRSSLFACGKFGSCDAPNTAQCPAGRSPNRALRTACRACMEYIVRLFFTINVECTFKRIVVSTDVITPNQTTHHPPSGTPAPATKVLSGMRTNLWLTGQR
jgi:hypothetical protein